MSDFRYIYKGDFDPVCLDTQGETFVFGMRAIKPARIGNPARIKKGAKKRHRGKQVMVATPSMTGDVWLDYHNSYVHSIVAAANAGWTVHTNGMTQNSLITMPEP